MKGLLKFITCGSVDDGKSTLIGHILYDAKLLYADQEKTLELDSKVGSRSGAIDYSLLLDGLMAEREQGITIDVAYRYFTTDNRSFIVADTPGHEEYTRNMAVGASFADLSVILVDASQGVLVQTRRHARICKLMGIRYFVFAVNKMDLVGYSEARFREIEAQIAEEYGYDYWISFSCLSKNIICEGTPIAECATIFAKGYPHLKMIGVNCTKPEYITGLIHKIKENCDIPIGVYPNSGEEYDAVKKVWFGKQSALSFEQHAYNYMKSGASAVGGCCTTVAKHVEEVVKAKKRFSEEQK